MSASDPITRRALGRLAAGGALATPAIIAHAAPSVIRVGQIEALTGPSAAYGIRAANGARLAMEQLNKAGGFLVGGTTYTLDIAFNDMANDTRQAVTLVRQYAAQPEMICCIGPTNSVGFVAMVPVMPQLALPLIADGSGVPVKEWNNWVVRVNPVNTTGTPLLLKKVVAKEKIKRLAVLFDQTQDSQRSDAEVCKAYPARIGYDLVAYEAFRTGDPDFSAEIATIRASRPDAIFIAAAVGDGVKVVSQIREAGIEKPLISGVGSFFDPVYWDGCKGGIDHGYGWLAADLQAPSPVLKSFLDAYQARYDQQATVYCGYGADAVSTLVKGLQTAGKVERGALREALATLDFVTPIGTHVHFKNPPDGENLDPTVVCAQVTGRGTYAVI
jgi:branched-chain amino acid transport system substrate-binding protein